MEERPAPVQADDLGISVYFETQRLVVRKYRASDAEPLFRLMSHPGVHTYTKDRGHPWDRPRAEQYIRYMMRRDFQTLGCFHGAVVEKHTNRLIGLCGLNPYQEGEPEMEIKLGVPHWGRGYATELGEQMIRKAFAAGVKGIYGMAQPENAASRRVLEKIGMQYTGVRSFHGYESAFYYLANRE